MTLQPHVILTRASVLRPQHLDGDGHAPNGLEPQGGASAVRFANGVSGGAVLAGPIDVCGLRRWVEGR